jgi:signal transduction histidine kinase
VSTRDDTTAERSPGFWERSVPGWHAGFAVLVIVAAAFVVIDRGLSEGERQAGVGLCAALAAWYVLVGRKALGYENLRLGLLYVAGVAVLFLPLALISQDTFILLFILYPQIFACIERVPFALGGVVALSVAGIAGRLAGSGVGLSGDVLPGVLNMVFAALLGLWIAGIIRESEQRAELLAELERTRGELADANRREGVLAERERLAQEIHDTLAQGFTSLLMLIRAASAAVPSDPDAVRERLASAEWTARDNLAEARSLVAALGPADLRQADGLVGAIERLVARFEEETGIVTGLVVTGGPVATQQVGAGGEVVLLRAAQEALHNVRKHAGAGRVNVRLVFSPQPEGQSLLEVSDDGCGFEPGAVGGFGLVGMARRAEQLGGTVTVISAPGEGTTLRVVMP